MKSSDIWRFFVPTFTPTEILDDSKHQTPELIAMRIVDVTQEIIGSANWPFAISDRQTLIKALQSELSGRTIDVDIGIKELPT